MTSLSRTFALLGLPIAALACSSPAPDASIEERASASSVSIERLDAVSIAEVQAEAVAQFSERLDVLAAAHPDVTTLGTSNVGEFVETTTDSVVRTDVAMGDALRSLLAYTKSSELSLTGAEEAFSGWVATQLPAATVAAGWVECKLAQHRFVIEVCNAAADEKALATAKNPRGIDMQAFVSDWRVTVSGMLGARFVRPVKTASEPTNAEVKALAGVSSSCDERAWGPEAVDGWIAAYDALGGYSDALKGRGFTKRWYWACGDDSWGEDGFALLDEHGQVWAFGRYVTE